MNIKVYSTPICPACDKAKTYLKDRGVSYEEINVEEDKEKAIEMINMTGQTGVPVITIGEHILVGFSRQRLDLLIQ